MKKKADNDNSKSTKEAKSSPSFPNKRTSIRGQSSSQKNKTSTAATTKGDNTTPAAINAAANTANAAANTANAAAADTAGKDNTPKADKSSGASKALTPNNSNKVTPSLDDAISEE